MKISEWLLDNVDSHGIYDSAALKAKFKDETGMEPVWPEYTDKQTAKAIKARGLGGTLKPSGDKKLAYGWTIAKALADKYTKWTGSPAMGRGTQFRDAVSALRDAGF